MTRSSTLLCLFTLVGLIASCASSDRAAVEADDPAFLIPRANHATLIVSRADFSVNDECSFLVVLNSIVAGKLVIKGWVTMYPPAGTYTVSVQSEGVGCPSAIQIRTRLESNQQQRFQVDRTGEGKLRWSN